MDFSAKKFGPTLWISATLASVGIMRTRVALTPAIACSTAAAAVTAAAHTVDPAAAAAADAGPADHRPAVRRANVRVRARQSRLDELL
jgi:hypothetical protein